jgi:mannose-6-phosphate isomerase-like protein (cupin superfamily)
MGRETPTMLKPIRRIVTGHNEEGRSVFLFDGLVHPGKEIHDQNEVYLWVTEQTPANNAGRADAANRPVRLEPPPQGSVFRFVQIPPEAEMAGLSAEKRERLIAKLFQGLGASHARVDTTRSPAMHKTRTLDYVILLSGEVTLLLDEGEVDLTPFNVVVQRGTNHTWVNRGKIPALLAVAMIDADPV